MLSVVLPRRGRALLLAAALFVTCGACKRHRDEPKPADGDHLRAVPEPDACPAYARAWCERVRACDAKTFDLEDGDDARCVRAIAAWCALEVGAPDVGETADTIVACTAALPSVSCDDWSRRVLPASCEPSGARRLGEPCALDAQCASGFCGGSAGGLACGRCAELPRVGERCARGRCLAGAICGLDDRCKSPAKQGDSCDGDRDCALHLACDGKSCRATAARDEACDETWNAAPGCDEAIGMRCFAGRCEPRPRVEAGGACTSSTMCLGGECDPRTRKCVAAAQLGEACDATRLRPCIAPATCASARCALPDVTRCAR